MPDHDGIERFAHEPLFGCTWCQARFGIDHITQHRRICGPKYRATYGFVRGKNADQVMVERALAAALGEEPA